MSRDKLVFHAFHPELRELPARANRFNDLVQSKAAPATLPNPALPAPPIRAKIGDTLFVRAPVRFLATETSGIDWHNEEFGERVESMRAEKDAYDKWLKQREAELQSRVLSDPSNPAA